MYLLPLASEMSAKFVQGTPALVEAICSKVPHLKSYELNVSVLTVHKQECLPAWRCTL